MQKVYEEIKRRTIFQVSTKQLEDGERPGWIRRTIYFVRGERIILVFDVQKQISAWKAYAGIIRLKLQSRIAPYVPNTQALTRAPAVLREQYEDFPLGERIRDSKEDT